MEAPQGRETKDEKLPELNDVICGKNRLKHAPCLMNLKIIFKGVAEYRDKNVSCAVGW